MKKLDIIIIIFAVLISAGIYFSGVFSSDTKGEWAVVYVNGKEYARYDLNTDATYDIKVDGHENVLKIENRYADMIDADCPDKLCVKQSDISYDKETIVCLPNRVVVEIESGEKSGVDAVAN